MSGGSGGSSGGGEGSGGGLLVDGGGVWVRFSPSSLSTTTASPALSSPGEWTTALDWASMKGALHDRRLYGGSMMLATTTTATTAMEVKKTAAVAGKRNDRGSFGGRGGGWRWRRRGQACGVAVRARGVVASWPVLLVGSAKEQQRIAQGIIHRGGKLELGLQRLAHAELQLPESGRAVDGS